MEKINVAELLKDCPKGMELDCYLFDGLEFDHIDADNEIYPIVCRAKNSEGKYYKHTFTEYGWYTFHYDYAKCVIFPKGKTTWEGFVPLVEFKDGDILCNSITKQPFILKFFDLLNNNVHSYCGIDGSNKFYTSSNIWAYASDVRLATEEEKAKLFKAIKDNGYKWNAETKTLKKLVEPKFKVGDKVRVKNGVSESRIIDGVFDTFYSLQMFGKIDFTDQDRWELVHDKFDLNTLVPFESRVLVRDNKLQKWSPAIWGFYDSDHKDYQYRLVGVVARYCIPYEHNEHLLGTTDDCDEFYKPWDNGKRN